MNLRGTMPGGAPPQKDGETAEEHRKNRVTALLLH